MTDRFNNDDNKLWWVHFHWIQLFKEEEDKMALAAVHQEFKLRFQQHGTDDIKGDQAPSLYRRHHQHPRWPARSCIEKSHVAADTQAFKSHTNAWRGQPPNHPSQPTGWTSHSIGCISVFNTTVTASHESLLSQRPTVSFLDPMRKWRCRGAPSHLRFNGCRTEI
jgi:hypothetical protein